MQKNPELLSELTNLLREKQLKITVAESCTGGMIASLLTDLPGSSNWFERGFVTYSNRAKEEMLGIRAELIQTHGAVSKEVAEAMALGALSHSAAHLSIAVTGIAGPSGGTSQKPVGTVWLAWAGHNTPVRSMLHYFPELSRQSFRERACHSALEGAISFINRMDKSQADG